MSNLMICRPTLASWAAVAMVVVPAIGLLSACDDKPRPPVSAPATSADPFAHARRVAMDKISSGVRSPAAARFRGVQAYQQADAHVVAVCGQVNPAGRDDQAFLPFVAVVTYPRQPEPAPSEVSVEPFVGNSNAEATRMYIEMTSRCGENGGPRQIANRRVSPPLPPLPSDLPDQVQPQPAATNGHGPAGQFVLTPIATSATGPAGQSEPVTPVAAGQTVTMRQAGNIRVAPVSGSQLVRVAPKGAVLKVFAQATGGWLQVGERGDSEGWVHSSLVETP